jgi:hypothetical protein
VNRQVSNLDASLFAKRIGDLNKSPLCVLSPLRKWPQTVWCKNPDTWPFSWGRGAGLRGPALGPESPTSPKGRGNVAKRFGPEKCRSKRSGFTLIEMVATIGMVTFVLTAVAVTISSLHHVNQKLRKDFPLSSATNSLGLHLRSDAHFAKKAESKTGKDGEPMLSLQTDDRLVEYSAKHSQITRIVLVGDKTERREVFPLHPGTEVTWSVIQDQDHEKIPQITLTIRRHTGQTPDRQKIQDDLQVIQITASVGVDHAIP